MSGRSVEMEGELKENVTTAVEMMRNEEMNEKDGLHISHQACTKS